MDISVLYEDSDLVVINKPAGLRVHGDGKQVVPTVVDWIIAHHPEIVGVGEPMLQEGQMINRPGIVHRLDQETSGVLVIAKHQDAFLFLKQQFKDRRVTKEYKAFVWGHFKDRAGIIDQPIGRNKNDFRRWQAGRGIRGETRDALTAWQIVEEFSDNEQLFSFISLWPKTGRTHQLRVHMSYIQRPIVSDMLYAPSKSCALGFKRVALHAHKIAFTGLDGKEIAVEAPYPADFVAALAKITHS